MPPQSAIIITCLLSREDELWQRREKERERESEESSERGRVREKHSLREIGRE